MLRSEDVQRECEALRQLRNENHSAAIRLSEKSYMVALSPYRKYGRTTSSWPFSWREHKIQHKQNNFAITVRGRAITQKIRDLETVGYSGANGNFEHEILWHEKLEEVRVLVETGFDAIIEQIKEQGRAKTTN